MINLFSKIDEKFFSNTLKKIYQNYLLKNVNNFLSSYKHYEKIDEDHNNKLSELCEKHGSDKGGRLEFNISKRRPHFYSSYYFDKFDKYRDKFLLIFECGIGSKNKAYESNMGENGKIGASLKVWREFFYNAEIFGADIDKNILFESTRINTFYIDQKNNKSITKMWEDIKLNNFDLIIDDGNHSYEAAVNLFFNSFDKLKTGGLYIIEDVHIAYLIKLANKLKNYSPNIISSNRKNNIDDYLFIIRKN